ncbi:MAG TPA: FAD-dependent oxidoreductase, partial [Dehalococcoidales bacterium]|nr:FAD-dependent oxidoreductase [Dehalococcoidales bacterium]
AVVKGLEIEDLPAITRYMQRQLEKQGVDIRLGREADKAGILELNPDIVVLANGGIPVIPTIPGIENRKVVSSEQLHHQLKFLLQFLGPAAINKLTRLWMPLGKKVVIIGGGIQGCELAEFLVKRGREVTIADTAEVMGEGMVNHLKLQLFAWFREKGVKLISGIKKYVEINDKGLVVLMPEGYNQTLKGDSIIAALPLQPDTSLIKSLEGIIPEIYTAGDCAQPNLIAGAISDGYRIGRSI